MKCGGFFCTHRSTAMRAQALSVTHARISLPHARAIMSVVYRRYAENEPVSRIKMADYRALVSMGRYSYLRNETQKAAIAIDHTPR